MSFKRVHALVPSATFLLCLVACSGPSASEQAKTRDSNAQDERVDLGAAGAPTDLSPETPPKCKNEDGSFNLPALKWLNKLEKPAVYVPNDTDADGTQHYKVTVKKAEVQMLPPCLEKLGTTTVLAYGGKVKRDGVIQPKDEWSSPGPTFEMERGSKATVDWVNAIEGNHCKRVKDWG